MGATDIDGTSDDTTAAALRELMTARHAAGDLAGALPVAEQLLAESQQRLGPQHPEGLSLARRDRQLATASRRPGDRGGRVEAGFFRCWRASWAPITSTR